MLDVSYYYTEEQFWKNFNISKGDRTFELSLFITELMDWYKLKNFSFKFMKYLLFKKNYSKPQNLKPYLNCLEV